MYQNSNQNQLLWMWISSQIEAYSHQSLINKQSDEIIQNVFQLYEIGFFDRMLLDIDQQFFSKELQKIKSKDNKIMDLQSFSKKVISYSQSINSYLITNCNKKLNSEYEKNYFDDNLFTEFYKNNISSVNYSLKKNKEKNISQKTKINKLLQYDDSNQLTTIKQQLNKSFIELVKLQFYLVLQSSNQQLEQSPFILDSQEIVNQDDQVVRKNPQFIQRICNLPEQVQNYLMQQIKIIQCQKILKITQLKQLLTDLQSLQEENQYFKQQIQTILVENEKLQKRIQQQIFQEDKYSKQIIKYHTEKQQLFQELGGINSLQQFIQIMTNIDKENQLLENTISELEEKNYQLQKNNAESIHNINKNAQEITKINEEIDKFKKQIKGLNQDIQFYDEFCNSLIVSVDKQHFQNQNIQESSFKNVLRQNQNIYNEKIYQSQQRNSQSHKKDSRKKVNQDSIKKSAKNSSKRKKLCSSYLDENNQQIHQTNEKTNIHLDLIPNDDEDNITKEKEKYRNQLMKRLQNLYKQISDLTSDITVIKEQNKKIDRRNKVNQNKIKDLKVINEAFMTQLQSLY